MDSSLSDLVLDSRIQVEFSSNFTYRFTFQSRVSSAPFFRRRPRKDTWQAVKLLGRGSYGTVSLHKCLTSEGKAELQAVKTIEKTVISEGIDYYRELEAIAKFSQKKYEGLFVEYIGWYENDDSVFIVMEYMEYGDLDLHLKRPLPENEARVITLQIAEGLNLLHENGFAHRDLKPANIFVVRKGPHWWVKIGDFGFSKRVDEKDALLRSCVGTPIFLAPEVHMLYSSGIIEQGTVLQYTKKVDIWALGVLTFYMIFHDYPFSPRKPITLQQYMGGEDFPFPKSRLPEISKACKSFIKAAMAPDASERLSAKQATENEWLMRPDLQIVEMASLRIKTEKLPDNISTEVSQEVLKPLRKHDSNNGNAYPPGGNVRADVPPNSSESSTRKESTAVKFDPSETRTDSPSYEHAMQLQLKELQSLHSQGMEHFAIEQHNPQILEISPQISISPSLLEIEKATNSMQHTIWKLTPLLRRTSFNPQKFPRKAAVKKNHRGRWVIVRLPQNSPQILPQPRPKHKPGCSDSFKVEAHYRTMAELGQRLHEHGDYNAAQSHLELAASGLQKALGPTHVEFFEALYWLGHNHYELCHYQTAEVVYSEVAAGLTEILGTSDRKTLNSLHAIGLARSKQGKYREAELVFRSAFQGMEQNSDKHDQGLVRTLFQIGLTLYKQGNSEEAEPFFQDALNRRDFLLGPGAADTIECAFWLGRALFDLKNYHESEEAFRQSITRRQDSRDMSTNHWLGLAMYCQGKYKQAILFLRRAFSLRNAKCGEHDLDTLCSSYWLGLAYYYQARYAEAEPLLFQALSGMKKRTRLPGVPNQDTLDCRCWYEEVLQLQGKNEMAELARQNILQDHSILFGPECPNRLLTVRRWVRSLEPQKKFLGANSGF